MPIELKEQKTFTEKKMENQAICFECGSDRVSGYYEDEDTGLFVLECISCGNVQMEIIDNEKIIVKQFTCWFE